MDPALIPALLSVPTVGALIWARWRDHDRAVFGFKAGASALFMVCVALQPNLSQAYGIAIAAGLGASLVGDLFLVGKSKALFGLGLFAFLAAHAAYLTASIPLIDVTGGRLATWILLGLVPVAIAGYCHHLAWPKLGNLAIPGTVYAFVLSATTVAGLGAWLSDPGHPGRILLGVGVVLFFVSDIAVVRQRFITPSVTNRLWGLPTYYAAQLVLAFSVGRI